MPIAHHLRHRTGAQIPGGLVHHGGQQNREQVGVDPLAHSGAVAVCQRRQDSAQRVQAGQHVDQGHAGLGRIAGFGSGDAHQAADRLDQEVVAWQLGASVATESSDRAVDQVGTDRAQVLVTQSQFLHGARPEVLDHDVGAGHQ